MKTNQPTATLRSGNKPKPSEVETAKETKDAAVKAAERQNKMCDGQLAVIPSGKDHPSTTSSGN